MKIRKTPMIAKGKMSHKHFFILDKNSFGRCKYPGCTATKQFPVEKKLELRASEHLTIENLAKDSRVDPDAWLNENCIDFDNRI